MGSAQQVILLAVAVWHSLGRYWIHCLIMLHGGEKKKRGKTFVINNYVSNYQSRLAIGGTGIPRAFALIKCFACSLRCNDVVWKEALSVFGETERPWEPASWVNKTSVSRFRLRETETATVQYRNCCGVKHGTGWRHLSYLPSGTHWPLLHATLINIVKPQ